MTSAIPSPNIHKHLFTPFHGALLDSNITNLLPTSTRAAIKHHLIPPSRVEDDLAAGPEALAKVDARAVVQVCAVGGELRGGGLDGKVDEVVALRQRRRRRLDDGRGRRRRLGFEVGKGGGEEVRLHRV